MKSFFKMVFASCLGVLVAGIIGTVMLIFIVGAIGSVFSTSTETVKVKPNSIFRIMLDQPVAERTKNGQLEVGLTSVYMTHHIGLCDILKAINKAAIDPNIKLAYLDLSELQAGMAHVEEIRAALEKFKESGKPIIAYGDNYSQSAYYLATIADKVYLNPYGDAALTGLHAEVMFYKGLLDKLQVEVQIVRHGKFKSAVEPFIANKMSDENREQYLTFIRSIWEYRLEKICHARQIDNKKIHSLINNLDLLTAQDALNSGLVDALLYKDELLDELCSLSGAASESELKMVDLADYASVARKHNVSRQRIAVVYADGEIFMGKGETEITSWNFANTLRTIRNDENIKAVVFRVNSPGGSAQASEIIARELALLKAQKPVVVSMSNYAASGGYWIAAPADKIIVNPASLTGSIGVFGVIPNIQKGLNNHLGITVDEANSNTAAGYPSIMRQMTAREREVSQASVELIYSQFINKVADARGLAVTRVDEIGQGRIWSGIDAVKLGLADELGGITEAIDAAANLAGLEHYRLIELPTKKTTVEQLLESLTGGSVAVKTQAPEQLHTMERFLQEITEPGVYARLPYDITVN
ncbi:MAG: signal peptide peptidase SppA [Prevotellaceae bacterium]|jgi:protease-4|nr:signal peptide peptidase SppA [Prevotellaceae bacterium]